MKAWDIVVDGNRYEVKPKGNKLLINGQKVKLKELNSRKEGMFRVYQVPVGGKMASLYVNNWIGGMKLAMDGVDCATGTPFTPPVLPKWAYVFMILHCVNFINGALGVLLAMAGVAATIAISCNTRMPVAVRVLLDILLVIVSVVIVFGIAIAVSGVLA